VLSEDPWVVFPGNLQGRHAKETGAKGATLVTVKGGRVAQVEHRALDAVRWAVCEVDLSSAATGDDVVDRARERLSASLSEAECRPLAARVLLLGTSKAHGELAKDPELWGQQIRVAAMEVGGEGVWVEKIRVQTRTPINMDALSERDDAIGELVRSMRSLRGNEEELRELLESFSDLRHKLPQELREGEDGIRLSEPGEIAGLLDDVEQVLIPRLLLKGLST
jgi:hypothetical protein